MATDLTPAELTSLRRLLEAATPGPWRLQIAACDHDDSEDHSAIKGSDRLVVTCADDPDAALIAALVNAAPRLIEMAERAVGLREVSDDD